MKTSPPTSSGFITILKKRLAVLRLFSIQEILLLLSGKLFAPFRSPKFLDLQDREIKLEILNNSTMLAHLTKESVLVNFEINNLSFSCSLRLAGSDVWVFNQVICYGEYQYVIDLFNSLFDRNPEVIIDAGANIGLTTIMFKAANLKTRILAIEPDEGNHAMAKKNFELNSFSLLTLEQCALWSTGKRLEIINDFRDKMEWSFRVQENEHGLIKGVTPLEAIMSLGGSVDIFKIDIEGGESIIFDSSNDMSWLSKVRMLALEIHDEYGARENITGVLIKYGFQITNHGELTVAVSTTFPKDH